MRKTVVFTGMEGILLDNDTCSIRLTAPSVDLLIRRGFPVVPVSSKTAVEIRGWMKILFIHGPFICENGGGIFIPDGYFPTPPAGSDDDEGGWKIPLASGIDVVREMLRESAREAGVAYRGFGDMSREEISRYSGLQGDELSACIEREYDEPFVLERDWDLEKLGLSAGKRGLALTREGNFFHAAQGCDRGQAVRIIADLFREADHDIRTVAVGDGLKDLGMLMAVDRGYLVLKPDGTYDPDVPEEAVSRIGERGPKGFRAVTEEIVNLV
jgi:mannosyl-3-phosphoglycerate phosphatase